MKRLIPYLKPAYLFRLNDATRTFAEVPDAIMLYCFGSSYFELPPLEDLLKFRVVVCTCMDATMLISGGASNISIREYYSGRPETAKKPEDRSHWTHLFIDEAGQAIEPETDIPLLCIMDEAITAAQVILCGDHQQLGPKTYLPELQYSYLERLMTTVPLYRDHPQSRNLLANKASSALPAAAQQRQQAKRNSRDVLQLASTIPCFTNLVQNYRSHPKMLMMPSHLFYNDTLVASADTAQTHALLGHDILPNPDCPIVFIGVKGVDRSSLTEAISWRNDEEAEMVLQAIERLLHRAPDDNYTGPRVSEADIGVIAPFREQVKAIRQVLRMNKLSSVNVGTVEDYQGQEHRVMLISTTRSRAKYLDQDVRQGLGLVHFRKRINVALTRAKAMLIIVGNPELLILDDHWNEYLHFCIRNAAYTGCPLPDSVLNASANDQKRGGAGGTMGRLELNDLVSQYVDKLDSRRWLGRRQADAEMADFVALPSDLEDEYEDDGDDEEDEDGEEYDDEDDEGEDGGAGGVGGDTETEEGDGEEAREEERGGGAYNKHGPLHQQLGLGAQASKTEIMRNDFDDGASEEDDAIRPEYDTHPIYYGGSGGNSNAPTVTSSRASDSGIAGGTGARIRSGSLGGPAHHGDTSMTMFEMELHDVEDMLGVVTALQKHEFGEAGAMDKRAEENEEEDGDEEEEDECERRAKERHALGTLNVDGDTPDMKALSHTLQAIALDSTRKPMHSDTPELYAQAKEERLGRGGRGRRLNGRFSSNNSANASTINNNSSSSNSSNNNTGSGSNGTAGYILRGGNNGLSNPYWNAGTGSYGPMLRPAFQPPPPDHQISSRHHSPMVRDLHANGSGSSSSSSSVHRHGRSPYGDDDDDISFPSSDRTFKRLSSSQLVLEKPFDPAARGISEYY
ncbi:hypothetical protein BGZ73_007807 [Actinomortierella ambigua]|nr:hypothetical protein BGZ73_007807 [Actinomortierella ambigua]